MGPTLVSVRNGANTCDKDQGNVALHEIWFAGTFVICIFKVRACSCAGQPHILQYLMDWHIARWYLNVQGCQRFGAGQAAAAVAAYAQLNDAQPAQKRLGDGRQAAQPGCHQNPYALS